MRATGWLSQCLAEVPSGERWLGDAERRALAGMGVQRRRMDWLLGRWTAKAAVGDWLGMQPDEVEILAASDGAPEAWLEGQRAPVTVSISHRAGRAIAAVAHLPAVTGCDLELIEPRSDAFVREWLTSAEQRLVASACGSQRALLTNLIWSAKEAAAKVRREGLRLNVRQAQVTAALDGASGAWRGLRVDWGDGAPSTAGWWRAEGRWVLVVAAAPDPEAPRALSAIRDGP
jgi:4'-phosphopantetheinyl transferase